MKDFKDKFEILTDTVEKNLKGRSVLDVQDEAGKKMGEPGRKVGLAFSFITNMTVNSYMTRRRYDEAMRKAISTVGEKSHIEKAAAEFGYYDRSNFDNEVERLFGAKPAEYTSGEVEFVGMKKIEVKDLIGLQIESNEEFAERVTEIIVIVDHKGAFAESQKELLNDRLDCQAAYGIDLALLEIIQNNMADYSRDRLAKICGTINGIKAEALVNLQDVLEDLEIELSLVTEMLGCVTLSEEELDDLGRNISEIEDLIDDLHADIYNVAAGDMNVTDITRTAEYWQEIELSYKKDDMDYDEEVFNRKNPYGFD